MKYFNKTRTIELKITDREVLKQLKKQSELLNKKFWLLFQNHNLNLRKKTTKFFVNFISKQQVQLAVNQLEKY